MKTILIALLALSSLHALAQSKVIYGTDDREDVVNVTDNLWVDKSQSTAGMFASSSLSQLSNGDYRVVGSTLRQRGWCSSERFSNQVTAPVCSGFIIADDVLVTAGHCIARSSDCRKYLWAFDFKIATSDATSVIIPRNSVYRCKSIISRVSSNTTKDDWAMIRLDRKVLDRPALSIRRSGKIADNAPLVLIGHPKGLPLKIADGSNVRSNAATKYFVANTDSYAGNSGSPVLDATTGVVEGILVRGEIDYYRTDAGCYASLVCPDTGCRGEDITRITNLPALTE